MNVFDILFVSTAALLNALVVGVYLTSRANRLDLTKRIGDFVLLLAIPFGIVLIDYIATGRPLRYQLSLGLILVYLLIELLLDRIMHIEFRKMLIPHVLYIALFYAVQFALITTAFYISRTSGWLVSISFWILLAALIYSLAGPKKQANNK
jgi:hypothetical protein